VNQPSLEAALRTADQLFDRQLDATIGPMGRTIATSRTANADLPDHQNGGLIFGATLALATLPTSNSTTSMRPAITAARGSELLWTSRVCHAPGRACRRHSR
jgi:hypothetical protein